MLQPAVGSEESSTKQHRLLIESMTDSTGIPDHPGISALKTPLHLTIKKVLAAILH